VVASLTKAEKKLSRISSWISYPYRGRIAVSNQNRSPKAGAAPAPASTVPRSALAPGRKPHRASLVEILPGLFQAPSLSARQRRLALDGSTSSSVLSRTAIRGAGISKSAIRPQRRKGTASSDPRPCAYDELGARSSAAVSSLGRSALTEPPLQAADVDVVLSDRS